MNINQIGSVLSRNSTHILTGVAVAGVLGTAVLAVKGTPRAEREYYDLWNEKQQELIEAEGSEDVYYKMKPQDYLSVGWKPYLPAALVGLGTIAAIVSINTIGTRRQAALAAGATLTANAYREYREAVIEKIGKDDEEEVRAKIVEKKVAENPPSNEIVFEGNGESMFYDTFSSRYFSSDIETVRRAVNEVNLEVINNNYATMNDFYREIGLAQISMGDEFGWTSTNKMDVYFTPILAPGTRPVVGIDYYNAPIGDYTNPFAK